MTAPTWIDRAMADGWACGESDRYYTASRWFVFLTEGDTGFMVQSGNASHDSFHGDDTCYSAEVIASAIDRWAAPGAGLHADPTFFEDLELHVRRVRAAGSEMEIIRAEYLVRAMRQRTSTAEAEDAAPFPGHELRQAVSTDQEGYGL